MTMNNHNLSRVKRLKQYIINKKNAPLACSLSLLPFHASSIHSGGCSDSCTTRVWFTGASKSCLSPLPATPPCPTLSPTRTTRLAQITSLPHLNWSNAALVHLLFRCKYWIFNWVSVSLLSPGRSGPVGHRQLPIGWGWECCFDRLDDHTLDTAEQPGPLR